MTTTNVADARDLYSFHRTNPFFTGSIQFRVRAQRKLYGEVVSGLPVTTYGPWSPIYTDVQPPLSLGTLGTSPRCPTSSRARRPVSRMPSAPVSS